MRLLSSDESSPQSVRSSAPVHRNAIDGATLWTQTAEFRSRPDPSDPQKGRFGGLASRDGYTFTADSVSETRKGSGWYTIDLRIERQGARIEPPVIFYVHDTFP